MKIRFNSDADLPLKEIKMYDIVTVITSVLMITINIIHKYFYILLLYRLVE